MERRYATRVGGPASEEACPQPHADPAVATETVPSVAADARTLSVSPPRAEPRAAAAGRECRGERARREQRFQGLAGRGRTPALLFLV
ncbi:hypothetical protein ADK89_07400, partial [Streptomyces sp. XY37]